MASSKKATVKVKSYKSLIAIAATIALTGLGVYLYVSNSHAGGMPPSTVEVPAKDGELYIGIKIKDAGYKNLSSTFLAKYGAYLTFPAGKDKTLYQINTQGTNGQAHVALPKSSIVTYFSSSVTKGPNIKFVINPFTQKPAAAVIFALPGTNIFAPAPASQ